jgi:type II secretory pathway pseudopilin PulG
MELLIVLAIFIILASFGTGGLIGFRETMFVKENVEKLKQDIELARQKSLLIDRDVDDTWVYGIGIDFRNIGEGTYSMFKWCSPYENFGNDVTRSKLLGWDPDYNVGDVLPSVQGIQEINVPRQRRLPLPIVPDPIDPGAITDDPPVAQPPEEVNREEFVFNAFLPINKETTSCMEGTNSIVRLTGEASDSLADAGSYSLMTDENNPFYKVSAVVFEAITGKAFLYNNKGEPVNYYDMADFDPSTVLDIVIQRDRSSKFDVLSIYPSSGTVIHHVYSNSDIAPDGYNNVIEIDGKLYKRYTVVDEINSYRD